MEDKTSKARESREALLGRILKILGKLPAQELKLIVLFLERRYGT